MKTTQELESLLLQAQNCDGLDFLIENLNEISDEPEYPISLNTINLI